MPIVNEATYSYTYSSATESLSELLRAALIKETGNATVIRIPRSALVYTCGDRNDALYLIESGQVKTVAYARDGRQCLLSIYTAGEIFAEPRRPHHAHAETASAMRPTTLWRVPFSRFRTALADQDLLEVYLDHLSLRLSEQRQVITNLMTLDSERRLASVLLLLAGKIGRRHASGTVIEQHITHEELSDMVGTTRSRVGLFLKRFAEAGLVHRLPGSFLVVRERRLSSYLQAAR